MLYPVRIRVNPWLNQLVHDEEATGNLSLCLGALTVGHRRMTNTATKQRAEGSQTLESNFEADVGHAQLVAAKQLFRFCDTSLDEVLMRCLVVGLPEKSKEVIARKARFLRHLVQAQRMVVAVVDKLTRTTKPLKRFEVC